MRRDSAKAADYARRHNVEKSFTDASELIDLEGLNSVYVATPPNSHLQYCMQGEYAYMCMLACQQIDARSYT